MKRLLVFVLPLLLFASLAACQAEPEVVYVTVEREVVQTEQITATPQPPAEAAPAESTPEPATDPTAEATAEPTATLSPARATQAALLALMPTRDPASDAGSAVAADDYVGKVNQACEIVTENYVRDNFNGVDWNAVCDDYRARAASVTSEDELYVLLSDLIAELGDDHSRFVPPGRFAAEFDLPGESTGRPWPGFQLSRARENDQLMIWYVCEFGPAASAGLQRGDVILAINGEPVPFTPDGQIDFTAVSELMYANPDSGAYTVQRGPDAGPEEIALTYGGASGCDGWIYGLISESPRLGYIRIPAFDGTSEENLLQAINLLEEDAPLEGLIVDVRHNPGGNSDSHIAVFTTGDFGTTGPLRADSSRSIYRIRGPVKWNETTPVVVLTDGASHSASEYFATAMQQGGRATIVGMPTAGNTEGINSFSMGNGTVIRLAWTTLQLPDGSFIEGAGVQPDVRVPLGAWGLREQPDVQLQAGIQALLDQIQ